MKGFKTLAVILAIGFGISFWWLGPLVVSSFIAGMYFMWLNYKKMELIRSEWGK